MGNAEAQGRETKPKELTVFLKPRIAVQKLLEQYNYQGVIVDGIAASLLGKPRFTADIDVVILSSVEDIPQLIDAAAKVELSPRITEAFLFAQKNRVLLLRHMESGTNVDIILGMLPFELEMIDRAQTINIGRVALRLPSPEDLIIQKAVAHRQQDLADIEAIAVSHSNLDQERIQFWVKQFGEALVIPDLWEKTAPLL